MRFKIIEIDGYRFEAYVWPHKGNGFGKFCCDPRPSFVPFEFYDTFDELMEDIKLRVYEWQARNPQTMEEWIDLVYDCTEKVGYEDYQIDGKALEHVLNRYADWKNRK